MRLYRFTTQYTTAHSAAEHSTSVCLSHRHPSDLRTVSQASFHVLVSEGCWRAPETLSLCVFHLPRAQSHVAVVCQASISHSLLK